MQAPEAGCGPRPSSSGPLQGGPCEHSRVVWGARWFPLATHGLKVPTDLM